MLKSFFSPPVICCFLLFLVFPVCVSYQLLDPFITPRVLLVSLTVFILCVLILFKSPTDPPVLSIPAYAFVAFLLLSALSIYKSLNPGDAWFEWMKTFLGLPVLLLTAFIFNNEKRRDLLLKFSQVSTLVLSTVYCYQWIYFLNHTNLEFVLDLRVHTASTFGNKNFYAEIICMLLPFAVVSSVKFKKLWRWLSSFNVFAILASIVLTGSYAVMAAFAIACMTSAFIYYATMPGRKISIFKISGIALAVLVLALTVVLKPGLFGSLNQRIQVLSGYIMKPELMDTAARSNSNSTFERLMLWRNSVDLAKENPLTGCGLGNWKLLYPKFGISGTGFIEAGNVHYEHPHNDFLLIVSESGMPALAAFILFLVSLAWLAMKEIRSGNKERMLLTGILFVVLAFTVTEIFSFPRVRFYGWILLAVYGGLLLSISKHGSVSMRKFKPGEWKATVITCALISCWSAGAAAGRLAGEMHSMQVQLAKNQKNFARLFRESEKASSWYFPIDETATPFTWYKGMALFYSGDIEGAKAAYGDALKKNPYHIQLLNDLATACEQSGERGHAIEIYKQALAVTPYFPNTLLNISACYFNSGDRDSAFIYIDKTYGLKLSWQQKNSYDVFLPAILREKIYADTLKYSADLRHHAVLAAADTALVSAVYRLSKKRNVSFETALSDSLRNR